MSLVQFQINLKKNSFATKHIQKNMKLGYNAEEFIWTAFCCCYCILFQCLVFPFFVCVGYIDTYTYTYTSTKLQKKKLKFRDEMHKYITKYDIRYIEIQSCAISVFDPCHSCFWILFLVFCWGFFSGFCQMNFSIEHIWCCRFSLHVKMFWG